MSGVVPAPLQNACLHRASDLYKSFFFFFFLETTPCVEVRATEPQAARAGFRYELKNTDPTAHREVAEGTQNTQALKHTRKTRS